MDDVRRADQVASEASGQTVQLEFLHKSGLALRPGGTPEISRRWNRRDRDPKTREPRRGGRPKLVCRPSGAPEYISTRFRWLRSAPPPANIRCASGAKNMCRNFSCPVC